MDPYHDSLGPPSSRAGDPSTAGVPINRFVRDFYLPTYGPLSLAPVFPWDLMGWRRRASNTLFGLGLATASAGRPLTRAEYRRLQELNVANQRRTNIHMSVAAATVVFFVLRGRRTLRLPFHTPPPVRYQPDQFPFTAGSGGPCWLRGRPAESAWLGMRTIVYVAAVQVPLSIFADAAERKRTYVALHRDPQMGQWQRDAKTNREAYVRAAMDRASTQQQPPHPQQQQPKVRPQRQQEHGGGGGGGNGGNGRDSGPVLAVPDRVLMGFQVELQTRMNQGTWHRLPSRHLESSSSDQQQQPDDPAPPDSQVSEGFSREGEGAGLPYRAAPPRSGQPRSSAQQQQQHGQRPERQPADDARGWDTPLEIDDGASPAALSDQEQEQQRRRQGSTPGASSWDRIRQQQPQQRRRQQQEQEQPQQVQEQQPSQPSGAWEARRRRSSGEKGAPPPDEEHTYRPEDGRGEVSREQAQREFDAMVEAERGAKSDGGWRKW